MPLHDTNLVIRKNITVTDHFVDTVEFCVDVFKFPSLEAHPDNFIFIFVNFVDLDPNVNEKHLIPKIAGIVEVKVMNFMSCDHEIDET